MALVYSFDDNWSGESVDPNNENRMNENHSSERGGVEVERLTKEGLALLRGAQKKDLKEKGLIEIRDILVKDMGRVAIEKGIHQRGTEPHIRARVASGNVDWTAHIHLSELSLPGAATDTGMFAWKAVAVSVNTNQTYPQTTVRGVRKRRDSVDFSVFDGEKRRLAEEARKNAPPVPVKMAWGKI